MINDQKIIELYQAGKRHREILDGCNCTQAHLCKVIKRARAAGIITAPKHKDTNNSLFCIMLRKRVHELHRQGLDADQIAGAMKVSRTFVLNVITGRDGTPLTTMAARVARALRRSAPTG